MYKQHPTQHQTSPIQPTPLLAMLLLLCIGSSDAALISAPPPIIDTEPPINITLNPPLVAPPATTYYALHPVVTLDMATEITSSIIATDAISATSPSTDITGFPSGQMGPLAAGLHTITWTATDLGNNSLSTTQSLNILPEVNLAVDQRAGEGNGVVTVTAYLSGTAPSYPVTLPYTISGTATSGGDDHNAVAGNIVITSPATSGSVSFAITNDAPLSDPNETVIFTLGALPGNVIAGSKTSHTVTIVENNLAPIIAISATQGSGATHNITSNAGLVTLDASATYDPNGDAISGYDWSASDNALVPTDGTTNSTFKFNPAGLTAGAYTARLTVRDAQGGSSTRDMLLRLYTTAPVLSTTDDSDDDGKTDSAEGILDSDGDGIPNYLDAMENPAWLPGWGLLTYKANLKRSDSFVSGPITFSWKLDTVSSNRVYYPLLLATEPGLKLGIGPTAFANGSNHGRIDTSTASLHFGTSLPANIVSADGQVVDIEISGLGTTGQSVYLVIPQTAPLPSASRFKVISSNHLWQDFTNEGGTSNTLLYKVSKTDQYCPPPGSGAYTPVNTVAGSALDSGIACIELLIKDGGPNDYDGKENGVIRLLGAPFVNVSEGGVTITLPPEFSGTPLISVESLDKIKLTEGGGRSGAIGLWGVLGLLVAFGLRRR